MELTGGADCGALEGDEKSGRKAEDAASGGSVRVERWVRPLRSWRECILSDRENRKIEGKD